MLFRPPEDAVAGGGLAARLARKISAVPPRRVVRLNLELLQSRIDTETSTVVGRRRASQFGDGNC